MDGKITLSEVTIPSDLLRQAHELAWAGQQKRVCDLCTKALDLLKEQFSPELKMDLLDQRAEAYMALGNLDLAAQDANTMVKLANSIRTPFLEKQFAFIAQALNRQTITQMRQGNLTSALRTAARALKAAQKCKQNTLISQSKLCLAEVQMRTRKNQQAIQTIRTAVPLFQSSGDHAGEGRAYWVNALSYSDLSQNDKSRSAAQQALDLCQSAGDQYGIGNALVALSFTDIDITDNID